MDNRPRKGCPSSARAMQAHPLASMVGYQAPFGLAEPISTVKQEP